MKIYAKDITMRNISDFQKKTKKSKKKNFFFEKNKNNSIISFL